MLDFIPNVVDGIMVGASYALLGLGFTLVFGVTCIESFVALSTYPLLITGQISFGQQAYFGSGTFAGGAMTSMWGFGLSTALLAGGLVAGGAAAVVRALTFRLGGLYCAIATLSFAELMRLA